MNAFFSWADQVQQFDRWCMSWASQHTRRTYQAVLSQFARWRREHRYSAGLTLTQIQGYLRWLAASHKARSTVRLHRAVLLAFCRVQAPELAALDWGTPPRQERKERPVPSAAQMRELLEAVLPAGKTREQQLIALRNRAFWELLYGSGLRLQEACSLTWQDLQLGERTARILGKGRRVRVVPLGECFLQALAAYQQAWFARTPPPHWPVFTSWRAPGRPLNPRTMQRHLQQWFQRLGLPWRATPHQLRHGCATHMLEQGAGLRQVQQLLGHARLDTTQIYTRLSGERLRRIYDQTHPAAAGQPSLADRGSC